MLYSGLLGAQVDYCQIQPDDFPAQPDLPPISTELPALQPQQFRLFADSALVQQNTGELSIFAGNVLLQRDRQILQGEVVVYDNVAQSLDVLTGFTYWDDGYVIQGQRLTLFPEQRGEMHQANYWLLQQNIKQATQIRGAAERIVRLGEQHTELHNTTYTSCLPQNEDWKLYAKHTLLDQQRNIGISRHVKIKFFGLPVFYTPYISYPLTDKRKSGFLTPSFGTSSRVGIEYVQPYYFNLNPSYDATLTARSMSQRGILLDAELRYLFDNSSGQLNLNYLNYDRKYQAARNSIGFVHQAKFNRWYSDINYNRVSDHDYFQDLGNDLQTTSLMHLEQRADLHYFANGWQGLGRLQAYQTLDANPQAKPYRRLPQLLFKSNLPEINRQFNFSAKLDLNRFTRDIESATIGNRLDAHTAITWPMRSAGAFLLPRFMGRYTHYQLTNHEQQQIQRFIWGASLDSGLIFERYTNWFATDILQTLEPRLLYRYTAYKDQSEIPIFDTAYYDLTYGQLFREEMFSGADRINDANQLSIGLSSRILETQTGKERLLLNLGQIYYFQDRKVILPHEDIHTVSSSSIIAELTANLSKSWLVSGATHWNPHNQDNEYTVLRLRYNNKSQRIFNISYRLRAQRLEQADLSFHWAINNNWRVLGRWNQSILHNTELESYIGLEYESCCWAMRIVAQRYLRDFEQNDFNNGLFVQFHLKGLGGAGRKADLLLEQTIPGYEDRFK